MKDIGGFILLMDYLTIGGRDAASNSAVIRKHLVKNDRVFHGRYFWITIFCI